MCSPPPQPPSSHSEGTTFTGSSPQRLGSHDSPSPMPGGPGPEQPPPSDGSFSCALSCRLMVQLPHSIQKGHHKPGRPLPLPCDTCQGCPCVRRSPTLSCSGPAALASAHSSLIPPLHPFSSPLLPALGTQTFHGSHLRTHTLASPSETLRNTCAALPLHSALLK